MHDAPVCPACGAVARWVGDTHWETAHEFNCAWMLDPYARPYDNNQTYIKREKSPNDQ